VPTSGAAADAAVVIALSGAVIVACERPVVNALRRVGTAGGRDIAWPVPVRREAEVRRPAALLTVLRRPL
jgi:hypothetical protein